MVVALPPVNWAAVMDIELLNGKIVNETVKAFAAVPAGAMILTNVGPLVVQPLPAGLLFPAHVPLVTTSYGDAMFATI